MAFGVDKVMPRQSVRAGNEVSARCHSRLCLSGVTLIPREINRYFHILLVGKLLMVFRLIRKKLMIEIDITNDAYFYKQRDQFNTFGLLAEFLSDKISLP